MSTATPPEWKIDYQAAADHCHDADYATHARRLIECLSNEISWAYYENTCFPASASVKEVVTGNAVFLFDKEEVPTPPELIETHTYLLKESRVIGAIGISAPAITKRPDSRGFQMSNMYGRTEDVFGKSYDKGHHVCHGAGGGADWNLFPQLRSLNRGWSDEGKLYRQMEAYVAANPGTMFFSRPIHLDGSLCPSLLEYGVLMPDRKVWWATFSNVPGSKEEGYGRKEKVPMPPELAGIPEYGRRRKKAADGSANSSANSLSVMIVRPPKSPRAKFE
ncbi:MAG: hypothetical protein KA152_09200 [Verrucomicrobiales bacterium]|nr:hypothetical protein [Verrucomicrobiales bacterium]